jgi:RNA polymerase sigma-70 factor (ECF subfamily)
VVQPTNAPPETAALIERAIRGEAAAFRALFHAHVARVHRLVHRLVGPRGDLEDLVQTVFVEGFRSLPSFRGEALFATWLGRIAVRTALRAARRPTLRLVPLEEAEAEAAGTAGPERTVEAREALGRLDALLSRLSPKRRAAFVLHVLEGYPIEEVAALLGAGVSAVKVRIHDARREIERHARADACFAPFFRAEEPR